MALRKKNALAILVKIQESVIDLVQDPFGNYAVSEIIKVSLSYASQIIDLGHQLLQAHFLGNQDQALHAEQPEVLIQRYRALSGRS